MPNAALLISTQISPETIIHNLNEHLNSEAERAALTGEDVAQTKQQEMGLRFPLDGQEKVGKSLHPLVRWGNTSPYPRLKVAPLLMNQKRRIQNERGNLLTGKKWLNRRCFTHTSQLKRAGGEVSGTERI